MEISAVVEGGISDHGPPGDTFARYATACYLDSLVNLSS